MEELQPLSDRELAIIEQRRYDYRMDCLGDDMDPQVDEIGRLLATIADRDKTIANLRKEGK